MGSTLEHSFKESVDIWYVANKLLLTHLGSLKRLLVELSPDEILVILYQASVLPPTRLLRSDQTIFVKQCFLNFMKTKVCFTSKYTIVLKSDTFWVQPNSQKCVTFRHDLYIFRYTEFQENFKNVSLLGMSLFGTTGLFIWSFNE